MSLKYHSHSIVCCKKYHSIVSQKTVWKQSATVVFRLFPGCCSEAILTIFPYWSALPAVILHTGTGSSAEVNIDAQGCVWLAESCVNPTQCRMKKQRPNWKHSSLLLHRSITFTSRTCDETRAKLSLQESLSKYTNVASKTLIGSISVSWVSAVGLLTGRKKAWVGFEQSKMTLIMWFLIDY